MALSVYVHIPYCLQRCRYCDFTTFEQSEIMAPEQYVKWVLSEIRNRRHLWTDNEINTLYFGGGTPSLIAPELIVAICNELANAGLKFGPQYEATIEINPATIDARKLDTYVAAGINRFSVGAQTFDDALLRMCGRKHNADDTRETLRLLRERSLNYSFDLLFALPGQTINGLAEDLNEVADFAPPHLSAYCLTVPESHPMSRGRPPEDEQVDMFALIENRLSEIGLNKYEISNFAKIGFESRHNLAYWRDVNYWGIGLSSHSYLRSEAKIPFGMRFWNPKALPEYANQSELSGNSFQEILPSSQYEALAQNESLTDFCHMFLRTADGVEEEALRKKFPAGEMMDGLWSRMDRLVARGLLTTTPRGWTLSREGQLLSNKVFEELTFL